MISPERFSPELVSKGYYVGDLTHVSEMNEWLTTLVLPIDRETFGVPAYLSARADLVNLQGFIEDHPFNSRGKITIIDSLGRQIFDPNFDDANHLSVVQHTRELISANNPTVPVRPYTRPDGTKMLSAYTTPPNLGWGVIVEEREEDAYYAVTKMNSQLVMWIVVGFLIAALGAIVFAISLTRPLHRLMKAARSLAKGDLDTNVTGAARKDEIGELSSAFNKMVGDLKHYIVELTATTQAKERAESELKLARNIQQSFLPTEFPDIREIDVFGMCESAREVGGDYFDFFTIDQDRYGLVIGDVSGKGVPAALFMAVSRTLFRMISAHEDSPEKVMTKFNDRLVEMDQGSNMFITLFYGIINVRTGNFTYSSAGHNMPYICATNGSNSQFRMLPQMKTMVAGMMDCMEMELANIQLHAGDIVFLYTDGLPEAINTEEEEYGEERMAELLNRTRELPAREIGQKLVRTIQEFQHGQPQFDDMTVLVMKVRY